MVSAMPARILFDECHSESWTISQRLSVSLSPFNPEYCYYGHLKDLLEKTLDCVVSRSDVLWQGYLAQLADVLVIAHPVRRGLGLEPSVQGEPYFSIAELDEITAFVSNGGGLFLLSEWEADRWGSNINDLAARFDFTFGNDTVISPMQGVNSHVLNRHFICKAINPEHPSVDGVNAITYHRGCSVTSDSVNCTPVISDGLGNCLAMAASHGAGRVLAIGDTDLFSIPYIGHYDNARFFVKGLQWLAGVNKSASVWPIISTMSYQLRSEADDMIEVECQTQQLSLRSLADDYLDSKSCPYSSPEQFLFDAEIRSHELPRSIRERLTDFKHHGNNQGVLLLRGLPTDPNIPCSPHNSRRNTEKETYYSEFWLSLIAGFLGNAISYTREKDGELFQNITPVKDNESLLSSESSIINLDFHTEIAFHPFLPDFLLLYCLRPDHDREAETFYASMRKIIEVLPLRFRAILFEQVFRTGIDVSFGSQSGARGNGPLLSVLDGDPYDPFMKYDLDLMTSDSDLASNALREVAKAANRVKQSVKLGEGDLLILDNRRCVHGRSPFTPRYDGYDRWLQRTAVARDMSSYFGNRKRDERLIDLEFLIS
jgi:L-asparagine oxygenase